MEHVMNLHVILEQGYANSSLYSDFGVGAAKVGTLLSFSSLLFLLGSQIKFDCPPEFHLFFFALWKEQEGRRGSIQMVLESLRGRDWPLFTHLFSLPLGHKVQSVLPEFPAITICGM